MMQMILPISLTVKLVSCLIANCVEDGTNIDNWDFEDLVEVVNEFRSQ